MTYDVGSPIELPKIIIVNTLSISPNVTIQFQFQILFVFVAPMIHGSTLIFNVVIRVFKLCTLPAIYE